MSTQAMDVDAGRRVGAVPRGRRCELRRRRRGGGGGDKIKVGLVTDTGGVDDRGFNQFSIAGLDKAESDLDIEKRVYVSNSADDYEPNLEAAVDDGNDLVIAVGFLLAPSTIKVATANPDVSFAGVDHFYGAPGDAACEESKTCAVDNALGMMYPDRGGRIPRRHRRSADDEDQHRVHGRRHQDPAGRQLDRRLPGRGEGHEAERQAPERVLERLQRRGEVQGDRARPDPQGSDVVFQVAGDCGLGALDAACEKNVTAIGVDADQSAQGDCVLTSALKPLTDSVFGVIDKFVKDDFKGGTNESFGVEDLPDAKLLAPFQGDVSQEVKDAVAKAEAGLKDGSIDPPATLK